MIVLHNTGHKLTCCDMSNFWSDFKAQCHAASITDDKKMIDIIYDECRKTAFITNLVDTIALTVKFQHNGFKCGADCKKKMEQKVLASKYESAKLSCPVIYHTQFKQMFDMGFSDPARIIKHLIHHKGDLYAAVGTYMTL